MRTLAIAAALLIATSANASSYRLPLEQCDPNPGGCAVWMPCYVTAYYDLDSAAGTAFECTQNCQDWNCSDNAYDQHKGTDFGVQGTYNVRPVVAGNHGVVIERNDGCYDHNTSCPSSACGGGFGNYVKLRHSDGQVTIYGHMANGSIQVANGDTVACGQLLGRAASSGCSTGPHVHFEVVDPRYGSDDPFQGSCGGQLSYWFDQGAYCELPSANGCTAPTADGAQFVTETIPDDTQFVGNASFTKTWTLKNTGTTTWTAASGYSWVFDGQELLGASSQKVQLAAGESIKPGATKVWSVALKAPAAAGTYRGYWRMDKGGTRFGDRVWVQIVVGTGPGITDDAAFESETIPDDSHYSPGAQFTKTWTMKNTGSTTWTGASGYLWAWDGMEQFGAALETALDASDSIAPGATKTWSVPMTAPATPGTYRGYWKTDHRGNGRFGDQVWVQIIVDPPHGVDQDGDGHASKGSGGDDCDDGDQAVYPLRAEDCDGKDNDCDGETDEALTRPCGTLCKGTETCANGAWGECNAPRAQAEACNGRDDDCDGRVDNDAECEPGLVCSRGACVTGAASDAGEDPIEAGDASTSPSRADAGSDGAKFEGGGCGCAAAAAGPELSGLAVALVLAARRRRR